MRISIIICTLVAATARAQEPTFEALGQAPVVGGDKLRARERALDEAFRQAVEQATGTVLEPAQLVARASDLKLRIYPKAKSYVDNYRVLEEGEAAGVFTIKLSATVATSRLARDLAGGAAPTPAKATRARAVVCVSAPGSSSEKLLRDLLAARGVELLATPAPCDQAAAARAVKAGEGQGALFAKLETAPLGGIRGTELTAARAKVTVEVVDPDGKISASESVEREGYDATVEKAGDEAGRVATAEAARVLEPKLAARWSASVVTGGVGVRLIGLSRYADYTQVTRALGGLPGVAAVEPRRFSRGEVELLVRTASTAAQLGAALQRAPLGGARVSATPEENNTLKLELAAPPPAPTVTEGGG